MPGAANAVERRAELLDGRADAGEVRHRLDAEVLLDPLDDLDRAVARRAARAVGDRDERRRVLSELRERRAQVLLALLGLRREELEREARVRVLEDLVDPRH